MGGFFSVSLLLGNKHWLSFAKKNGLSKLKTMLPYHGYKTLAKLIA